MLRCWCHEHFSLWFAFFVGFGSVGTIIEGPIIGFIAEHYGWKSTFYIMIVLSLLSAITMLKAARANDRIQKNEF